jgi:Mg-chelatase subunit ChlD
MKKSLIPILALSLTFLLFSQTREDRDAPKRDIFVILDVSGSMMNQNKFSNVREYLNKEIVDGLLKNGDTFNLITFGDYAVEQFSRVVNSDSDREFIRTDLAKIEPDHNYTDIGMAMEKLAEVLERREQSGVRRVILFITDGLNAPPASSPYKDKDIAVDERFRALGEKISKGGWFLYVIGMGGQTDARVIADAVPGSVLQTTGPNLDGIDVESYVNRVEEENRLKEEALAAEETARKAEEKRNSGVMGFLRRFTVGLGFPLEIFLGALTFIVIFLICVIIVLQQIFKTIEIVITDEKETVIQKLPPFGGIMVNSAAAALPSLGNENNQVMRIQRGAFGLKLNILDPRVIAEDSSYKKRGIHPLKGVITLANKKLIRVTVR